MTQEEIRNLAEKDWSHTRDAYLTDIEFYHSFDVGYSPDWRVYVHHLFVDTFIRGYEQGEAAGYARGLADGSAKHVPIGL